MMAPGLGKFSVEKTLLALSVFLRGSILALPKKGNLRTSASLPETAAEAAIAGLIKWVRPPFPWRPSKLRLEVEAQRSWGDNLSGFIAKHILHPGSRHSNPASVKILSNPSSSACFLTRPDPGTTMALSMLSATLRPKAMAATFRISSIRPLVQDPIKTLSMGVPSNTCPSSNPMYSKERFMAVARAASTPSVVGTVDVTGLTS
mmetsp:Transcript_23870/g.33376  ORF Transcript_23870/g.33376 Transcript_23870/m.33376 type:complete len:204 (+) Transcript_23870:264-875(+)